MAREKVELFIVYIVYIVYCLIFKALTAFNKLLTDFNRKNSVLFQKKFYLCTVQNQ